MTKITHQVVWNVDIAKIMATLILLGLLLVGFNQINVLRHIEDVEATLNDYINAQNEHNQQIENLISDMNASIHILKNTNKEMRTCMNANV